MCATAGEAQPVPEPQHTLARNPGHRHDAVQTIDPSDSGIDRSVRNQPSHNRWKRRMRGPTAGLAVLGTLYADDRMAHHHRLEAVRAPTVSNGPVIWVPRAGPTFGRR